MPDLYLVKPERLRWYMRGMHRRVQGRLQPFPAVWFERVLPDVADDTLSRTSFENATAESEGWAYMDKLYRLAGGYEAVQKFV